IRRHGVEFGAAAGFGKSTPAGTGAGTSASRSLSSGCGGAACGCAGASGASRPITSTFGSFHKSEEHTSELQSLMRISYAVFCLKKKKTKSTQCHNTLND